AFHTLKGSGRVVGATALAEFAWSIENLLNRLLDKTLTRSPAILGVLRDAVGALPQLIAQLEGGPAPTADVIAISTRAHALAAGRTAAPPPAPPVVPPDPEPAPAPAAAALAPETQDPGEASEQKAPGAEVDSTLGEIYARETASHVTAIRDWVARQRALPAPHVLTEPAYRACHTLAGSSKTAGARHGIRLAEPLNRWLR